MSDDAETTIHGNRDLPLGTDDRPLVTFALFAYNQERYIREAVEGAFSQTYEPLEIILSDDCSSDRTYQIMQEMAREYRGASKVIVRKGTSNHGLVQHIRSVTEISSGQFVVVAAGDDVSLPDRTTRLTELMLKQGSDFAASNYSKITEDGQQIERNLPNDYSGNYVWQIINAPPIHFASGAAACYKRTFLLDAFKSAEQTLKSRRVYNEDILFAAYSVGINSIPAHFDAEPLILYRINSDSLSNFTPKFATLAGEIELVRREIFRYSSREAYLYAILEIASHYPRLQRLLNRERIERDLRRLQIEIAASDSNILNRAKTLLHARTGSEFKIITARLLGTKFLAFMRYCSDKLRRPATTKENA